MTENTEKKDSKIKVVEYFDERFYKIEKDDGSFDYYPSTTTILGVTSKPYLAKWRGDIGNREADVRINEAAERGTRLHNAWKTYCQGGAVVFQDHRHPELTREEMDRIEGKYFGSMAILPTQDEMLQMRKLQTWRKILKPTPLITEQILYSVFNQRAGTADNIFGIEAGKYYINGSKPLMLEKGLYIADLKTGNAIDDDAFMQVADYFFMLLEMSQSVEWVAKLFESFEPLVGALIIHTGAKTKNGIEGLSTILRTREELEQDYIDINHAAELWKRKHKGIKPITLEIPTLIAMDLEQQEETSNADDTGTSKAVGV
mgnify:CR=1 FL=1